MTKALKESISLQTGVIITFLMAACLHAEPALGKDKVYPDSGSSYLPEKVSRRYNSLGLSFVNFEAPGVPEGSAHAVGLALTTGWRFSGIVSLEGGINWIPVCVPCPLPFPLGWMPYERGVYLNLGAGLRFNLVDHHSHEIVPWVSYWRTGHGLLGNYSVSGTGNTFAFGVEGSPRGQNKWQIALRVHSFTGGLEITEGVNSVKYQDQEIRAVELLIQIRGS